MVAKQAGTDHGVRLGVTLADEQGASTRVEGDFTPEDIKLLRHYVRNTEKLGNAGIVTRGMPQITRMNFAAATVLECAPYTDAELHELLHVLRPVILSKEPASFEKVAGLLGKRLPSDEMRQHLKALRHIFEHGQLSRYMQINIGGRDLFKDETLKLWLNGEEYHQDSEKSEAWHKFQQALTEPNTRAYVITQLGSKVEAALHLGSIAKMMLERIDEPDGSASQPAASPTHSEK